MRIILIPSLLIIVLFASNFVWAQNLPPDSSIQVKVLPSYSYTADDGTTVVLGEVQNNLDSPINAVTLGVTFMDDNSNTIEYKTGNTLMQVVPPGGKIPFSIISTKANPSITQVQVKLAGFRSSPEKEQALSISPSTLKISDKLILSGTVKNSGTQKSANTKLYMISYDAFQRVVAVGISGPINIDVGQESTFNMTSTLSSRAKSYMIIAESDNYQSKSTEIPNVQVTLPIMINNIQVTDLQGNKFSSIPLNASVKITSNLKHIVNSPQGFVYYVQVKQFDGQVEFIGKNETGLFFGSEAQNVSVVWTPHLAGSYYIETYVWNSDTIPLSSAGTRINVVLVK